MIRLGFLLLLTFNVLFYAEAQQQRITLKAGESLKDFKARHVYKYPEFASSKVTYTDGAVTTERLNYNRLSGKMEFIDKKGDTLAIINNSEIRKVVLAKDTFYFDKEYVELLNDAAGLKLGMTMMLKLVDKQKIGGYGAASSTSSIDTYSRIPNQPNFILNPKADHVFVLEPTFYFGTRDYSFGRASEKRLLQLIPREHQAKIKSYLKQNKVDFAEREDIEKILHLVKTLTTDQAHPEVNGKKTAN
ncbi:MAG TPA: hypothetical protein VGE26_09305 [Sphingobacteriaceae bacterium]